MSRIGKKPVPIEGGATVKLDGRTLSASGKLGTLTLDVRHDIKVEVDDEAKIVTVDTNNSSRVAKAMHGTTRQLIANMIEGVTKGYIKELEVNGVGYTAKLQGNQVQLKVGYADTRTVDVPDTVKVEINGNQIKVSGADKQQVGLIASKIRNTRKPEPYNGKGIKYKDEVILRKQGKTGVG